MKSSYKRGFSFGLVSGIITTLGLMVGLFSTTHSKLVVIGGILIIAVADALSDAVGIHISQEAENKYPYHQVWESTFATFISKFIFAMTFAVPVILFELNSAIIISIIWGLGLIAIFSYEIARLRHVEPYEVILEHLVIAVLVVGITYYLGQWVGTFK